MNNGTTGHGALGTVDRLLLRVIDAISLLLMVVGGFALMLMMVQVTADVIGKFVFNSPIPVTLEMVANYYMVAVVFLPLAAVERMEGNIHVELIYARLPRTAKRVLDVVSYMLFVWLIWLMTAGTWKVAIKKFNVGEFIMGSYSVIIWPTRFLVPIGCGLLLALLVVKLVQSLILLFRSDLDDPGNPNPGLADPVAGTSL